MNMTMLPNSFVDHYMANANGEFVKVYLFLLRHVEDAASSLSISMIADYLNNTENDVLRAFRYWGICRSSQTWTRTGRWNHCR